MTWSSWADSELDSICKSQRWRSLSAYEGDSASGTVRGRQVLSFSSNDYLNLTQHPQVREAALHAIEKYGTGTAASRLITGTRDVHLRLEDTIARWQGTQRALVFASGYAANVGVLSVLGTADVTIFSDALNHASIIDGCKLAKAATLIYPHRDIGRLSAMMEKTAGRKIVVTDSVFSMDGAFAPLAELAVLCARHGALLIVDEAHAVLGPDIPAGATEVLKTGTLSKALASLGGWVAGPRALIDLLINRARSFVFSTALTPADTAAALAALEVYMSPEGLALREQLRTSIHRIMPGHPSPIVPIILGEDRAALQAAEALLAQGIYVPAIRPPTVPPGTARLRITISTAHTVAMLEHLQQALHCGVMHRRITLK